MTSRYRNGLLLGGAAVVLGLLAWGPMQRPSRDDAPEPSGPPSRQDDRPRMPTPVDMAKQVTRSSNLPVAEQAAVDEAIAEKFALRAGLLEHSKDLFEVAMDPSSSDDKIRRALDDFLAAKEKAQARFRALDEQLVKRVSLRTRAKLTTSGVLDNGLGFMAGGRGPSMGGLQGMGGMSGMGRPGSPGAPGGPAPPTRPGPRP